MLCASRWNAIRDRPRTFLGVVTTTKGDRQNENLPRQTKVATVRDGQVSVMILVGEVAVTVKVLSSEAVATKHQQPAALEVVGEVAFLDADVLMQILMLVLQIAGILVPIAK